MNAPARLDDNTTLIDTRFTAPGIRCAGCIGKIERELPKVDGIEQVRVNFSAKRVAVRHSPALDSPSIVDALRHIGFEAQPVAENPLGSDNRETKRLLRALAVAGFGMMNIMLLSVSVWAGADGINREMFHWVSALIAVPVVAYSGQPFFASAAMALRYRRTNMDVPISIGVLLATGLSLYETWIGGEHAYFDGAVMLLFFLLAGRALDATMRDKARSGIAALLSRMGRGANVVGPDGAARWVEANQLEPGMIMLVAAGDALAADGVVIEGASAIDNAMLTGESMPEPVGAQMTVHAGAANISAPLRVQITAVAGDTAIAEIARLMDDAGQSRSRYVRIADRASRLYAPAVHSLAVLAFVGWMIAGAGWHQSLTISIAVLIITCPCALGLAVPAAQVVASNALVRRGLLVKDGSALERLAEVDVALFDKTGTLTLGEPRPIEHDQLDDEARSIALALAQESRHPLSRGLGAALLADDVKPANLDNVQEEPGVGITGQCENVHVALRRPSSDTAALATELVIGEDRFVVHFQDPVRTDASETVQAMLDMGIVCRIVSGDRAEAVDHVARPLGITARAGQSPADKLHILDDLKQAGHFPLMVGDGLNDGPALAAAHVAIAPGSASDVSQQAADAVFMGEKLRPVFLAIKAARATMRVVRQNFVFAIGYNVLAVPLALAGMVTPMIAALAMSGSSIIVVANSLRLRSAAAERRIAP